MTKNLVPCFYALILFTGPAQGWFLIIYGFSSHSLDKLRWKLFSVWILKKKAVHTNFFQIKTSSPLSMASLPLMGIDILGSIIFSTQK